jgi:hypothetical protein
MPHIERSSGDPIRSVVLGMFAGSTMMAPFCLEHLDRFFDHLRRGSILWLRYAI